MNERIQMWTDLMARKYNEQQAAYIRSMGSFIEPGRIWFHIEEGRKFLKIVEHYGVNPDVGSRSVHAFVDKNTGDVFKAASWKAPAKIARFNLLNDDSFNQMLRVCEVHGGYLYLR